MQSGSRTRKQLGIQESCYENRAYKTYTDSGYVKAGTNVGTASSLALGVNHRPAAGPHVS